MTIAVACTASVALLAASASGGDGNGRVNSKNLAKKECNALKRADKGAFKAAFGNRSGKHAMRDCKRAAESEINDDARNAAQECRALRDADPDQFQEDWGTNAPKGEKSKGGKKNAFGKCVSTMVKSEINDDIEDFKNAAQECRALRDADPDQFQEDWGTNDPKGEKSKGAKRNAFGKCVSATARELDDEDGEDAEAGAPTG